MADQKITDFPALASGSVDTSNDSIPIVHTGVNYKITPAALSAAIGGGGGGSGTVTSVSVVSANGLAGTVATATSTPAITLSTTVTGVVKGNGTALSAAVSGTDYAPATSGSAILKGNGAGGFSSAVSATDYAPATTGSSVLKASSGGFANAATADIMALVGSPTAAGVVIGAGTSAVTTVAPGTSGNILTSNGSAWTSAAATGGASGLVCLAVASASASATVDFTSVIDSTYDEYVIDFINVVPASSSDFWFRTSADNGSSFAATGGNYGYAGVKTSTGTSPANHTSGSAAQILLSPISPSTTASHGGISGSLRLYGPSGTASNKQVTWQIGLFDGTDQWTLSASGQRLSTVVVNAVRFMMSSGNITSGLFKLYGVRKSV